MIKGEGGCCDSGVDGLEFLFRTWRAFQNEGIQVWYRGEVCRGSGRTAAPPGRLSV